MQTIFGGNESSERIYFQYSIVATSPYNVYVYIWLRSGHI